MDNYAVRHALNEVWCNPPQDKQYIFEPARLTPRRGEYRYMTVEWQTIALPDLRNTYHVYQIGQLDPNVLGMSLPYGQWRSANQVGVDEKQIVEVYSRKGIQYPLFRVFLRWTYNRNLLIALEETPRVMTVFDEVMYLRVYSGAYMQLPNVTGDIQTTGQALLTLTDMNRLNNTLTRYRRSNGYGYAFYNGYWVNQLPVQMFRRGDIGEVRYDATIVDILRFPIKTLFTFDSTLDQKGKYLLHPKDKPDLIYYQDDCEFYLIDLEHPQQLGIYIHKNDVQTIRMVTHQDYSVAVMTLTALALSFPYTVKLDQLGILVMRRQGGYQRHLVFDDHRIHDLYHLDHSLIESTLLNHQGGVPFWQASQLENSAYTHVMRAKQREVTLPLVIDAYGYNALAKLAGDTPSVVDNADNTRRVKVPPGLQQRCIAYEFDQDGFILGYGNHTPGVYYIPQSPQCQLVEFISGTAGHHLSTVYDQESVPLKARQGFRLYKCERDARGNPLYAWQDVTDQEGTDYVVTEDNIEWLLNTGVWYTAVRFDDDVLAYDVNVDRVRDVLEFALTTKERVSGQDTVQPLQLPLDTVEIWLNGRALIEDLDYYIDWPRVIVVNKAFMSPDIQQHLIIRARGFPDSDFKRQEALDSGFVEHGILSRNGWYNVREDRVIRIIAEGRTFHRDQFTYGEFQPTIDTNGILRNGAPYQITSPFIPIHHSLPSVPTYTLKDEAVIVDREVERYLSLHFPEPEITQPSAIPYYHQVYSPFLAQIVDDLRTGVLDVDTLGPVEGWIRDEQLTRVLKSYEYLLTYDPVTRGVDRRYVAVHPTSYQTTVELNIFQFELLDKACQYYLEGKVDLNPFIRITQGAY